MPIIGRMTRPAENEHLWSSIMTCCTTVVQDQLRLGSWLHWQITVLYDLVDAAAQYVNGHCKSCSKTVKSKSNRSVLGCNNTRPEVCAGADGLLTTRHRNKRHMLEKQARLTHACIGT